MYGTQTLVCHRQTQLLFENDVKMYGTQTRAAIQHASAPFENDVKMYGTQTTQHGTDEDVGLRMM